MTGPGGPTLGNPGRRARVPLGKAAPRSGAARAVRGRAGPASEARGALRATGTGDRQGARGATPGSGFRQPGAARRGHRSARRRGGAVEVQWGAGPEVAGV